jgi:hypothetical protein
MCQHMGLGPSTWRVELPPQSLKSPRKQHLSGGYGRYREVRKWEYLHHPPTHNHDEEWCR